MPNLTTKEFNELLARQGKSPIAPPVPAPLKEIIKPGEKAKPLPLALATEKKPELNKLELRYRDYLDLRLAAGEILGFWTHPLTLKLADDCRYTPDFLVLELDRTLTFVEVKAYMEEDAAIKFRVAQQAVPWARFQMVRESARGVWEHRDKPFPMGSAPNKQRKDRS